MQKTNSKWCIWIQNLKSSKIKWKEWNGTWVNLKKKYY